ncbi:uncharacterized protein LOC134834996 [Culicoides brevitarsis]|uniref:uncharacterized protein LOC134834996 n=1 Tax=Culicoides brevitarsis TaxID=469753 RepID=UPI00307BB95F
MHDMPSENYNNLNASTNNQTRGRSNSRKKPFLFLTNLLRKKKILEIDDIMFDREMNHRARSEPSVVGYSCKRIAVTGPTSPAISTLSLTPGRFRNIDEDMQALRISRQDNPFVQKVLASRESLVDSVEEIVSDDATLMSQEDFASEMDQDPFTLPEVQAHMIRSPPPTSWPRSPRFSLFNFPQENNMTVSSQSSEESSKSAFYINSHSKLDDIFSSSLSARNRDGNSNERFRDNKSFYKKTQSIPRPHSAHNTDAARLPRPYSQLDDSFSRSYYK